MDFPSTDHPTTSLGPTPAGQPAVEALASAATAGRASSSRTLALELKCRWARGERPCAEDLIARQPGLQDDPEAAIDLIYEEICLREQAGQAGVWEDVFRRFPQWQQQLQSLQDCHRLLQTAPPLPRFPAVGETLGEYRLLAELGRGGRGRVFLAAQPALGHRPVVLKVTSQAGCEHLALARLQHTNIVPLYAAREDRRRHLRLLCMPYLGSATLAQLLDALHPVPLARRTGRDLVQALDRLSADVPVPLSPATPLKAHIARESFVRVMCWVGVCCADALQYAHERGLVHLDVKPSNVLVAADGQPMLLDFHLAHEPLRPDRPPPEELGGTYAYMPPEQRAAVAAVGEGRPILGVVDGRADIYSLGVVLYQALSGGVAPESPSPLPLHRRNPQVSVGLSDIIHKCLAADPARRYANAAALAEDLRRHLTHRPLVGVGNRSLSERWRKYRVRRPNAIRRALAGVALLGVLGLLAASIGMHVNDRCREAERALADGRRQWQQQRAYADAIATLQHGLTRVAGLPGRGELATQLRGELRQAEEAAAADRRDQLAHDLHGQVERLRMLLSMDDVPAARLRGLEATARALWEKRAAIRERLGQGAASPVDEDLLQLAVCWTDLGIRLAVPGEIAAARRRALDVLAEARELVGPRAILAHEVQAHRRALGLPDVDAAALPAARTPGEQTALGFALLRAGEIRKAAAELKLARDREPADPWANYYYGLCAYRLGQHREAAEAFSVCVGAAPHLAGCYYSRALARTALADTDQAVRDYDQALRLDPSLAGAWLNRGMLHYQQKHYDQALNDLRQALAQGLSPAQVHYNLALVHLARQEPEDAREAVERALRDDPQHAEAARLRDQLRPSR